MSAADIWMPLYVADFLADTTHLTTEESGAYLLLLMGAWIRDGRLPNDDAQLARISRLELPSWLRLRPLIASFFEVTSDWWIQHRLLAEKEKASKRCSVRQQVGKLGGPKTWKNPPVPIGTPIGQPIGTPNGGYNHSHSHSTDQERERAENSFPEIPPLPRPDFDKLAELRGVSKECADYFWNVNDARGWKDKHGHQIVKVEPALLNFSRNWKSTMAASGGSSQTPNWRKIQILEEAICKHVANSASTFYSPKATDLERADLRAKREKVKQLKAKELSNV